MFITQLFLIMLTVEKTDSRLHVDQNMVKATATLVSPGNVVFGTVCIQKAAGSDAPVYQLGNTQVPFAENLHPPIYRHAHPPVRMQGYSSTERDSS